MPPKKSSSHKDSKRVRMRDVANRCGVSISTVSLVLSGDGRIPEDTTRRVLQAVKALEYRPSVVARNLARRSSRTIGVILPEFAFRRNGPYYYHALEAIHSQTQPAGYKLIVEAANPVFLERRYYHRLLKEQSADGMIYLAAGLEDIFLSDMTAEPYPFLLLGALVEGVDLPSVTPDEAKGAQLAVDHLVSLGHKKIGHLAGIQSVSSGRDRLNGYHQAMKKAGLNVQSEWVQHGEGDMALSESKAAAFLDQGVTAVFAANDVMAIGLIRGLEKKGNKVPNDLAVVGMDNIEMAQWVLPNLTTVNTDIQKMAGLAAKYIINKIQSPLIQKDMMGEIPQPELIVRSSCGANS